MRQSAVSGVVMSTGDRMFVQDADLSGTNKEFLQKGMKRQKNPYILGENICGAWDEKIDIAIQGGIMALCGHVFIRLGNSVSQNEMEK